jgi:hypothetical protein
MIIKAGSSSFSTPPTMTQVNASSDINQVIALCNRRTSQIDNSLSQFSYAAPSASVTAALVTALQTRINALRGEVGVSSFSFTAVSSGKPIKAQDWIDLRSALVFTPSPITIYPSAYRQANNTANTYPTNNGAWGNTLYASGAIVGKQNTNTSGPGCSRHRLGIAFSVPSGANAYAAYTLNIVLENWGATLESFLPHFYAAATDVPASWFTNRDYDLGSGSYGSSSNQAIPVPGALVAARAGGTLWVCIGEDLELIDGGTGGSILHSVAAFGANTSQTPAISITQNFGF